MWDGRGQGRHPLAAGGAALRPRHLPGGQRHQVYLQVYIQVYLQVGGSHLTAADCFQLLSTTFEYDEMQISM